VVLFALIQTTLSVPPDFFRTGRGRRLPIPTNKRSPAEIEITAAACKYCGMYDPRVEKDCRINYEDAQRKCVLAFLKAVERVVDTDQAEREMVA